MKKNSKERMKYNYSSNEAQKLFEEFTLLLGEITSNVEEREKRLAYLEDELIKYSRLKYLLRMIFAKIPQYVSKFKDKIKQKKR